MARHPSLKVSPPVRFAALVVLVLLGHGLALQWLSNALGDAPMLKPMVAPMFTRVLEQQAPAPVEPVAASPAPADRPSITSVTQKAPEPPKPAASQVVANAEPVQPEPTPTPAPRAPPEPQPDPIAEPQAAPEPEPKPEPKPEPEPPPPEPAAQPASSTNAALEPAPAPGTSATSPTPPSQPASAPAEATTANPAPAGSAPIAAAPASSPASPASPASPILDTWPADTRLNYRLNGWFRGELYGSARVQWQRQDARYQVRVGIDVTPFVSLTLTSQGEVTAQGLSPQAYEELRGSGTRGVRIADDAVVLGDGRRLPRPPGVQDSASQFVELSHRFATGQERLEVGRSVDVWLARPGGVDLWTYDIVARQVLRSAELGPIDTFHLKPRPISKPRGNINAEMWFAPSLQYLPVRIRVTMGPETYVDLMVEKIEQR